MSGSCSAQLVAVEEQNIQVGELAKLGRDAALQTVVRKLQCRYLSAGIYLDAIPLMERPVRASVLVVRPVVAIGGLVKRHQGGPVFLRLSRIAVREPRVGKVVFGHAGQTFRYLHSQQVAAESYSRCRLVRLPSVSPGSLRSTGCRQDLELQGSPGRPARAGLLHSTGLRQDAVSQGWPILAARAGLLRSTRCHRAAGKPDWEGSPSAGGIAPLN